MRERRSNEWIWEVVFDDGFVIGTMSGNWKSSRRDAVASAHCEARNVRREAVLC